MMSLVSLFAATAHAQFRDDYESPDPVWKLANADCGVRVVSQKRVFEQAHGGSSSEHLRFVAGQGTHLYYTLDVGRSPIIDESNCSLWLKADRARLQLLVRVVLPRTLDERTGKPIATLLVGDEYGEIGSWQQLQVKDLPKLLARQTIILRRQFGPHVDPREAYVDLLVLNAYGGPGETNVWIDDLEIHGVIDPDWAKRIAPQRTGDKTQPDTTTPAPSATPPAIIDGNVLLVEHRPMLVRGIEHRGESLEIFKSLGFNTVFLATTPSVELNEEAKRFGLWLVAPPPDLATDPAAATRLDRVVTWQLGAGLGGADLASMRSLAAEVRSADRALRRPLLCGVRSDAWSYSRETDMLCWEMPPLFGPRSFSAASASLRAKATQARVGSPYWATIQLNPAPELVEQIGLLDRAAPPPLSADLEQARLAVLSALAAGARGLVFRSSTRLDQEEETAQQRAAVLRLLNLELNLIEPWFAGGSPPQDLPTGDPSLKGTVLQSERSRLVLLTREPPQGQFVMPPAANDTMLLTLPGVPPSSRFYHLTTDGLRPLESPPGGAGNRIVVPEAGHAAIVAVTQDPLVIQHLTRFSEAQRGEAVETRLRLAAHRLTATALVVEQIHSVLRPPREGEAMLRQGQRYLQEADQLLLRRDLTGCYRNTRQVERIIDQVRRAWWDSVQTPFSSPLTSPCCVSFDALPSHLRLAFRLRQGAWSKNGLPAGDCEQLEGLITSGWKQHRRDLPGVKAIVEVTANAPHGGASCLRLAAVSQEDREPILDEPPVAITTAPIQAREGQVARLHAFVRAPQPLRGLDAGLLVYDSFAGPALAEVVSHSPTWREVTLYRAISRDGPLTMTFALQGLGEAFVDDVTVELITP